MNDDEHDTISVNGKLIGSKNNSKNKLVSNMIN